jgi:hypothetical protein
LNKYTYRCSFICFLACFVVVFLFFSLFVHYWRTDRVSLNTVACSIAIITCSV